MFGLDYTIFRPHNVYGEHQNIGDRYRNVVGIFMNQMMQGEPMTIFGDGTQKRAFSHIDDVAPLIAGCVDVPAAATKCSTSARMSRHGRRARARWSRPRSASSRDIRHLEARNEVHPRVRVARQGAADLRSARERLARGRHRPHGRLGEGARTAANSSVRGDRSTAEPPALLAEQVAVDGA